MINIEYSVCVDKVAKRLMRMNVFNVL